MGTGTGVTALAAGGTVGVLLAVGLAIKALTKTMKESIMAYKDAPKLYAKALTSGLGLQFVSKRSILADIMGVSEQEVIKYAYAFNYLNPKISWASDIMAKTNANLTSVGWSFKILSTDMSALFAKIANDGSKGIRQFVLALDELVKMAGNFYDKYGKPTVEVGKSIGGAISDMIFGKGITNLGRLGLMGMKVLGAKADIGAAPPPISFMKQLPASSWERMGLVIGGGGGANPAKQTANNTFRSARLLEGIEELLKRIAGQPSKPFNLQNMP
jgi:hypothetical protein